MKTNLKKTIYLFLTFFIILTSCSKDGEVQVKSSKRTGEEYFSSIFFFKGEIAEKIPSFQPYRRESFLKSTTVNEFNLEIINNIKSIDPSFFRQFKKHIESKKYKSMQNALKWASSLYLEAALSSKKYGPYFTEALKINQEIDLTKVDLSSKEGKRIVAELLRKNNSGSKMKLSDQTCIDICLELAMQQGVIIDAATALVSVVAVGTITDIVVQPIINVQVMSFPENERIRMFDNSLYSEKLVAEIADAI